MQADADTKTLLDPDFRRFHVCVALSQTVIRDVETGASATATASADVQ